MKLIVGLGNPGNTYENTRHNAGFLCLKNHLEKNNITLSLNKKFNALVAEVNDMGKKTVYLLPQTFMNLSGEAVVKAVDYYKINLEDILVIYDDMDIPFGSLRLRESGSAGGHNGMKNIILHLASQEFKRVRIGISGHEDLEAKDYVLSKFSKEELEALPIIEAKVSKIITDFINDKSFSVIMGSYNGTV